MTISKNAYSTPKTVVEPPPVVLQAPPHMIYDEGLRVYIAVAINILGQRLSATVSLVKALGGSWNKERLWD